MRGLWGCALHRFLLPYERAYARWDLPSSALATRQRLAAVAAAAAAGGDAAARARAVAAATLAAAPAATPAAQVGGDSQGWPASCWVQRAMHRDGGPGSVAGRARNGGPRSAHHEPAA